MTIYPRDISRSGRTRGREKEMERKRARDRGNDRDIGRKNENIESKKIGTNVRKKGGEEPIVREANTVKGETDECELEVWRLT